MSEKMDKRKLLQSIKEARAKLEETVALVPEKWILEPGVEDGNSVKDILSHISIWERRMSDWLEETLQDKEPEMLPAGMTWDDLDRWNDETTLSLRDRTLSDVLQEFDASYRDALRAVEAASEEALVDPDRFPWRNGKPLWEMVSANMDDHYQEHEKSIRAWLESRADE